MSRGQILPFITDEDLYHYTRNLLVNMQSVLQSADERLYDNVVDPFSALFTTYLKNISYKQWLELEKTRQNQKRLENYLGDFHAGILASIPGWVESAEVIDIENMQKEIIAEVKNKHNTTKGNHKKNIYDDLEGQLRDHFQGYTGYYVEVIPKNPRPYDIPFTPSDNVTHTRRQRNERIRVIDGASFYALASDCPNALRMLYEALPEVVAEILQTDYIGLEDEGNIRLYNDLFYRAYGLRL